MMLALVPLGLLTVPIRNFQLFWLNLTLVALMPALYVALIHWSLTNMASNAGNYLH